MRNWLRGIVAFFKKNINLLNCLHDIVMTQPEKWTSYQYIETNSVTDSLTLHSVLFNSQFSSDIATLYDELGQFNSKTQLTLCN